MSLNYPIAPMVFFQTSTSVPIILQERMYLLSSMLSYDLVDIEWDRSHQNWIKNKVLKKK